MGHGTEQNKMDEARTIGGMTRRTKLIAAVVVLAVVFLLGFVPQYGKARALRSEVDAGQAHIVALQWKLKLAELRDLMGLIYLETNQKNYGVARQHSTHFFTKARQLTLTAETGASWAQLKVGGRRRPASIRIRLTKTLNPKGANRLE
jgi:hypothetical protein